MSSNDTEALIQAALPQLVALRHDIHGHPEIGLTEHRTAALVAKTLADWGIAATQGVGGLGVVATIHGDRPGQKAIGLRADMDALKITEQTGRSYASQVPELMHACGHDGHTAMLLGAARVLSQRRDFAGAVHFIFQPAEEGLGGARAMLDDGLFQRFPCDAVYGLHNMPGIPAGHVALRTGPLMAGSGRWVVEFRGTGGHGGNSAHLASDITISLAVFVQQLQTIVSRSVPAIETAVVSVGHIAAGSPDALNVMPATLRAGGTMRAFTPAIQTLIEDRIRHAAEIAAASQGATATVKMWWNAVPLINAAAQSEIARSAAEKAVGAAKVDAATPPVTGGEDFAFMMNERPGALIFLGNGSADEGAVHALHTPLYDFNDAALPHGVAYWVALVQEELAA